jgi:hypothetical protein
MAQKCGDRMRIPPDIIRNTEALLALLSSVVALCGLALTMAIYIGLYLSIRSADAAVSPQLDSAFTAISDSRETLSSLSQAANLSSQGIGDASLSLSYYSDSTRNISDSLSNIAAVPPFSLDSRLSSAAKSLKQSSASFSNAAASFAGASSAAGNATASLAQAGEDLSGMAYSLDTARREFRNTMFMLNAVALAAALALALLFSSVLMVSVSILLSHYPRFFEKKQPEPEQKLEPPSASHHAGLAHRHESQPPAYREWQPGQSRLPKEGDGGASGQINQQ